MILHDIVIGFDEVECALCSAFMIGEPCLGIAKHGTAKTLLSETLGRSLWPDTPGAFRFYDGPTEDFVSIAGIPNPKELAVGHFDFAFHDRNIFTAKVIHIDEIFRGRPNQQNMWFQIIQQHQLYGKPLPWEACVATSNPKGNAYAGNFSVDDALTDRFGITIPFPELQQPGLTVNKQVLEISTQIKPKVLQKLESSPIELKLIRDLPLMRTKMIECFNELWDEPTIHEAVIDYIANCITLIQEDADVKGKKYISTRRRNKLFTLILANAAYRMTILGKPSKESFYDAAVDTWKYAIGIPLEIHSNVLGRAHEKFKVLLKGLGLTERDRVCMEIEGKATVDEKILYMYTHKDEIKNYLTEEDKSAYLGRMLEEVNKAASATTTGTNSAVQKVYINSIMQLREVGAYIESNPFVNVIDGIIISTAFRSIEALEIRMKNGKVTDKVELRAVTNYRASRDLLLSGQTTLKSLHYICLLETMELSQVIKWFSQFDIMNGLIPNA